MSRQDYEIYLWTRPGADASSVGFCLRMFDKMCAAIPEWPTLMEREIADGVPS